MGDIVSSTEIGTLIRRYRQDAGLSQEKLAEMVGVSFQQIQKYENGANRISAGALFELAGFLDKPLLWFFPDRRR